MSETGAYIALIGMDPICAKLIIETNPDVNFASHPYADNLFEAPISPEPAILLCGPPTDQMAPAEVAQSLRMLYPTTPIYFVTKVRQAFHRVNLIKNGFSDAFLLPNDTSILQVSLTRDLSHATSGKVKALRTVQLIDVPPGAVLGFDLYLYFPANKRHIKYVSSTDSLDEKRAQRLVDHKVQSALVSEDQIKDFYSFTASQLRNMGGSAMSETEKKEKRERAVRDLLSGMFSESSKDDTLTQGRQIMADCQEIVKSYMAQGESKNPWYNRFLEVSASGENSYSHSANVSTFAALFSVGLGIGNPEEVALAGLLHDIGLSDLPLEISLKDEKDRTPEETAIYQKHPINSIELIKEKKMIVSENVMKFILQHHERYDGRGYPEAISGVRLKPESQLLALADRLDEMTTVREGHPRISHAEAIRQIAKEAADRPGESFIDPALLKKIMSLFPTSDIDKKVA
jgi:HD-GYP domain-containing protein (c-di-GMP phosphodiesterase class II)